MKENIKVSAIAITALTISAFILDIYFLPVFGCIVLLANQFSKNDINA